MKSLAIFFRRSILLVIAILSFDAHAWVRGIYINQATLENINLLQPLLEKAKENGINTFVVDLVQVSKKYQQNISLIEKNNIRYVARIVVFPEGGTDLQVLSEDYWRNKYRLVDAAVRLGAKEIQLDYIRYKPSQRPHPKNAENIFKVISFFKRNLMERNIPLQIDVFGVASFGHSYYIGQNLKLFAHAVDAMCPMAYPSHYEPYLVHAKDPYNTVAKTLAALRAQFNNQPPFKIYAFIELHNYRYPLSRESKLVYIYHQIKAVDEGNIDGWYAWSPNNKYANLFVVLQKYKDLR